MTNEVTFHYSRTVKKVLIKQRSYFALKYFYSNFAPQNYKTDNTVVAGLKQLSEGSLEQQ